MGFILKMIDIVLVRTLSRPILILVNKKKYFTIDKIFKNESYQLSFSRMVLLRKVITVKYV